MKVVQLQTQDPVVTEISIQPASLDIWDKKYRLKSKTGEVIDQDIAGTYARAAPDSMDGILSSVHEAGLTLKAGCGIGYEFSTLRPKGAFVSGAGAYTSGPLSFMDIFNAMCFTV